MASVEGKVTEKLEALVNVRLVAGRNVECLLDTGASCALVLPAALIDELELPIIGYEDDLGMVGGEQTSAYLALAEIEWLGEIRFAEVIVKDDFIIGTELLEKVRLTIDYPARVLIIRREE